MSLPIDNDKCVFQLALNHSPPLSEIFVFTDASPKDAHLYNTVKALTLEKQCKVYSNNSSYATPQDMYSTSKNIHMVL